MDAGLRDEGWSVNHKRVARLMRLEGLQGASRRRKWRTTKRANGLVEEATPEEIRIEITWDGESRSEVIRPDYEESRPNGPGCDPLSRTANVEVAF